MSGFNLEEYAKENVNTKVKVFIEYLLEKFEVDLAKEPSRSVSASPCDAVDYFKEMSEMFEVIAEAAGRSGFLKGGK